MSSFKITGILVTPAKDGEDSLKAFFAAHPLTDSRAEGTLFRVQIAVLIDCHGVAADHHIVSKGRGDLFELAQQVLAIVKQLPANWTPAQDADGNTVNCWTPLSFSIHQGQLNASNR